MLPPPPPAAVAVVVAGAAVAEVEDTGSDGAGGGALVPSVEELAAVAVEEEDYRNPFAGTEPQSRRPPSNSHNCRDTASFSLCSNMHWIISFFTCLLHFLTFPIRSQTINTNFEQFSYYFAHSTAEYSYFYL